MMRAMAGASVLFILSTAAPAQTLHDTFDGGSLDKKKWLTAQIEPHQIGFPAPGRCGARAISVVTRDPDGGVDCSPDEACQRAELRTSKSALPPYGTEVWYAFSFRMDGDVPATGSARTVIGQWKAPGDDSPFVAQRFDNGVFHITIQDNDVRRVIAKAEGDPDRMLLAQNLLGQIDRNNVAAVQGLQSLQSLYLLKRHAPDFTNRFFTGELQGALQDKASESPRANELSAALKLPSRALVPAFEDLAFVAEPEKYVGPAEVEITSENRLLPDPGKGWVDMVYRIRGGRLDNEYGPRTKGELEIWANGQKIVKVVGSIGYRLRMEAPVELVGPYFKFGVYRKKIAGSLEFRMDEFSQTLARADLPTLCAVP